ncbi:MAG: hypothetical protein WBV65_02745 [Xanthobacteraceae bacterium]
MRAVMLAMTAVFIFGGAMTVATTSRAQDSKTVIKHDDGDKTVIKKKDDDMSGDKKVIIHKNGD